MTSDDERPTKLRKLDNEFKAPGATESPAPQAATDSSDSTAAQAEKANVDPSPTTAQTATTTTSSPPRNLKDPKLHALSITHPGLSKNALKKLRRQQEWDAAAPQRRARRKEENSRRKAAKQASRAAQLAAGVDPGSLHKGSSRPRAVQLPVTLLVDCGFDGLMTDGERVSLGAQITRGYSANKTARWRVHLAVSDWGGILRRRFETVLAGHYRGWKGTRFEEADFKEVSERAKDWMDAEDGGRFAGPFERYLGLDEVLVEEDAEMAEHGQTDEPQADSKDGGDQTTVNRGAEKARTRKALAKERHKEVAPALKEQGEVVYLTAESPHILTEMKPFSTYIIGGIVDKNREKGLCYKRAIEAGMKTARLPIGEYMEMQSRKVLATNHVLEIMLKWLEYEDWGKAFLEVIPKRKGGQLKGKDGKDGEDDGSNSEIEADDVEDIDPDLDAIEDDGHANEAKDDDNATALNGKANGDDQ